jgi:hypothetical protein
MASEFDQGIASFQQHILAVADRINQKLVDVMKHRYHIMTHIFNIKRFILGQ